MEEVEGGTAGAVERGYLAPLVAMLDRDLYAVEHGLIAARCAALTARRLTLPESLVRQVAVGGLLHDSGKIAVDPRVLRKPGKLTEEDWKEVRRHPTISARIAQALKVEEPIVQAVKHHHERWDGQGYPAGLSGPEIPVEGQILAASELISAALTPRWYRPARSPADVLTMSEKWVGRYLDREVLKASIESMPGLLGVSSLSAVRMWTDPFDPRQFLETVEQEVQRAVNAFVSQVLWETARLFGRSVCERLVELVGGWLRERDYPVSFSGLRLRIENQWWESLGTQIVCFREVIGSLLSALSHVLGDSLVTEWMNNALESLPEPLKQVGLTFNLWTWQGSPLPEIAGVGK